VSALVKSTVCHMHRLLQEVCSARSIPQVKPLRERLARFVTERSESYVAQALEVSGSKSLGDLLFEVAALRVQQDTSITRSDVNSWEADSILAYAHKLMVGGDEQEGLRLSSSVATPIALETLASSLRRLLRTSDRLAITSKRRYSWMKAAASVAGVVTLGAVGAKLALPAGAASDLAKASFLIAAVAASIVTVAVFVFMPIERARWLLNRHKCELCRRCEFRAISDAALWSGRTQNWRDAVDREIGCIRSLGPERIVGQTDIGPPPMAISARGSMLPAALLDYILRAYERAHLTDELVYYRHFIRRYQREQGGWMVLVRVATLIALIGALVVLSYLVLGSPMLEDLVERTVYSVCLFAAAVPLLNMAIRAMRRSFKAIELTRETQATLEMLEGLTSYLRERAGSSTRSERDTILATLQECDRLLNADHWHWQRVNAQFH
jgi:hypothetical protein